MDITKPSQKDKLASSIKAINRLVRDVERLALPAFGPDLRSLSGSDVADALIGHRIRKNIATRGLDAKTRKEQTIRRMLAYDLEGPVTFGFQNLLAMSPRQRASLYKAKAWLHEHFSKVPRSHRFSPPSGETSESSGGNVDLLCKLQDPSQWRVSLEASHEAAAVCYHNHGLKRIVKARFRELEPFFKRRVKQWANEARAAGKRIAWYCFHRMFVFCCTIQNCSRVDTVPKNAGTDRPISMEPLWNMVAQLSFARDLREQLRRCTGINLDHLAALHRTLIRHANKATVDFSNASNSNWLCVLKWLLPSSFYSKLAQLRTPVCEYGGEYHPYRMLAPMGCGFTFEVMTIVLLALARAFDNGASVFGDDVIIECDKASDFIALTTALGWKVNLDKTFTEGNFRESCGGFHDLATGSDLLSYDFHLPSDLYGVTVIANKLYRLLEARQCGPRMRKLLLDCYCKLLTILPCETFREPLYQTGETLPDGVVLVPFASASWRRASVGTAEVEATRALHLYGERIEVRKKWAYKSEISRPKVEEVNDPIYLACYMRRGVSYDALRRRQDLTYISAMAHDGRSLATIPLFSFI